MEIHIIRHGQSANNAVMEKSDLRVEDPELTEVGWEQARQTAAFLGNGSNLEDLVRRPADAPERRQPHPYHFTHLYTSPMHRTLQTAQPIAAQLGLKPEVWVGLHEHGGIYLERDGLVMGYGGLTRSQMQQHFPDYVLPPDITEAGWWNPDAGQENIAGAYARAITVALALKERAAQPQHQDDRIILVAHGTFIDCLLKAFAGAAPREGYYHWLYNGSLTRLDIIDSGAIIMRYTNRVSHLPPELIT